MRPTDNRPPFHPSQQPQQHVQQQLPRRHIQIEQPQPSFVLHTATPANLAQLRQLQSAVFPIQYGETFYQEVLRHSQLTQLVFYNGAYVAAMCSRVEREPCYNLTNLYIMTLGVLPAYRRMGLGRLLLASVIQTARKQAGVRLVYLHVQTTNEAALSFYLDQGFRIYSTAKDYYQHISGSPDAHVLVRYL